MISGAVMPAPRRANPSAPHLFLRNESLHFQPSGGRINWGAFVAGLWCRDFRRNLRRLLVRMVRRAALAMTLVLLPGCSELARPSEATPPAPPAYVSLAANYLMTNLKDRASYTGFEISPLRWVDSLKGSAWLACIHFQDHGHLRTYALFIQDNAVVDARYAVETDACASQTYTQFDLVTGELGRPTAPVQPPLY